MGMAVNFVDWLKLNGSLLFGVTGWQVKIDPVTCTWTSLPCPRPRPAPLLFAVHSFMVRMPRGMSSFFANGARGASVVGARSSALSCPASFAGNHLFVMQP